MIVFWSVFLCGIGICIIFDFFRALRRSYAPSGITVALQDAIFCIIAFKLFFDMMYVTNNGHIRWYIPIAIVSGCVIYFFSISKYIIKVWMFVIKILKALIYPFTKILSFLKHVVSKPLHVIKTQVLSMSSQTRHIFSQIATKRPFKHPKNKDLI